ncbi:hypothetical protein L484_015089 [Morus notabilis]|uniref:Uncharacterized protein n=1 Tax=Morus notabilis TaxID=981085 RepID=W9S6U5_9ROSA|nr:hypothetical protein L484_015089 [Morus notabilis]
MGRASNLETEHQETTSSELSSSSGEALDTGGSGFRFFTFRFVEDPSHALSCALCLETGSRTFDSRFQRTRSLVGDGSSSSRRGPTVKVNLYGACVLTSVFCFAPIWQ